MKKQDIFVKSFEQFPDWKAPCPVCGGNKCISSRKDRSGAWCKNCGQNWKVADQQPEEFQKENIVPVNNPITREEMLQDLTDVQTTLSNLIQRIQK